MRFTRLEVWNLNIKLLSKVERYILDHDMINNNDKVVLGVSGGGDSMCLLDIMMALKDKY